MTKRSVLISCFLQRRILASVLACATLSPLALFAQQYQETDQVSNAGGQGAKFIDPHLLNPGVSLAAAPVSGGFQTRLENNSSFEAPWGLVQAPTDFGSFSHSILVGQFGGGEILAFDAVTGHFQGELRNQDNNVISIPGLWGLAFGAGNANSGGTNQLFFNAGSATSGRHGFFAPVTADLTQGNDQ